MNSIEQFFSWEKSSRDTIDFKKIYVDMAGDLLAGLALSEIIYWYLPDRDGKSKLRVEKDGFHWIAVKRYEWWERVRIAPRQADRAIELLIKAGILQKHTYKFGGEPTVHVRLIEDVFLSRLNTLLLNPPENPYLPDCKARFHVFVKTNSPTGENVFTKSVKTNSPLSENLTESTTKSTSETTDLAPAVPTGAAPDPFDIFTSSEKPEAEAKGEEDRKESQGEGSGAARVRAPKRNQQELYEIAKALAEVTGMDFEKNRGQLFREAKLYGLADVESIRSVYGKNGPWYAQDWRGKKGQKPTTANIRSTWGTWKPKKAGFSAEELAELKACYEYTYGEEMPDVRNW